eukprot:CAMPEP_0114170824 /NCGR_PEP_ID=MMETSP0043_2-20121206/34361_1 /TAXON_ID=464988 /ORGANISM="Hemiselmis andersenii, Strain CCMP644" /LENGTH=135 /DNA_ID=CAMNT_0001268485 /DNA_START=113 /DNA_END=521 /DNA_ORIENTATION=+
MGWGREGDTKLPRSRISLFHGREGSLRQRWRPQGGLLAALWGPLASRSSSTAVAPEEPFGGPSLTPENLVSRHGFELLTREQRIGAENPPYSGSPVAVRPPACQSDIWGGVLTSFACAASTGRESGQWRGSLGGP